MTAHSTTCPGCGNNVRVNRVTGRIRTHDVTVGGGWSRCPGSGEAPTGGASL